MSNIHHNHTNLFLRSFNSQRPLQNAKVLDVGCGDAYASQQMLLMGAREVHAYDPHKKKPAICDELNIPFFTNPKELHSDYDIVWMHHVLEHVANYLALLKIIRASMQDTGVLWMAVPNMASHTVFSPGHINNFMAPQLVEVLRLAEFGIKDISIWAHEGQLRVRVPKQGSLEYPDPMRLALETIGRCPSEALQRYRW